MKLSTKGRYATRALLDLALHKADEPVPLKDIASRQEISALYLEQLVKPLVSSGIVATVRGSRGGVRLLKAPAEVKVADVIRLFEGPSAIVECVSRPSSCPRSQKCVTRDVWEEAEKAMNKVLEGNTLQDLIERQAKRDGFRDFAYQI